MGSKVKTLDVIRRRLTAPRPPRDPRERLLSLVDGPISPQLRENRQHETTTTKLETERFELVRRHEPS